MKLSGFVSSVALFSASALAELYYPPILCPKTGDVFVPGQNYTLIWDTRIPANVSWSDVANFTSEVRIGFTTEDLSIDPNSIYMQWEAVPADDLNENGEPLYFYENQGHRFGKKEYQIPEWFPFADNYVVVWLDAYPSEVYSGVFSVVNGTN